MSRPFCLSEEEAHTKWCPHVRTAWAMNAGDESASLCTANRGNTDSDCRCVASGCMAWRWVETHIKSGTGDLVASGDTHGYCGLAGNPV